MIKLLFTALVLIGTVAAASHMSATDRAAGQAGATLSLPSLPDFYLHPDTYKVDPYIRAAAALQAMGKQKANGTLLALAKRDQTQVIVLCRMLFTKRAGGEFRRPGIGAALFVGGTDYPEWPLEPIELVDGVPFLITQGYELAGEAELPQSYLQYCLKNCDWSGERFTAKSDQEKRKALNTLLASPKWKARLDQSAKEFLSSQIK
jgi:hypothetical protein